MGAREGATRHISRILDTLNQGRLTLQWQEIFYRHVIRNWFKSHVPKAILLSFVFHLNLSVLFGVHLGYKLSELERFAVRPS